MMPRKKLILKLLLQYIFFRSHMLFYFIFVLVFLFIILVFCLIFFNFNYSNFLIFRLFSLAPFQLVFWNETK